MLIHEVHDLTESMKWCDICRKHQDDHCDECGQRFMGGESRYHSVSFHYHPASVEGVSGTRAIKKELCVNCYRQDFERVYEGGKAPDLPDRGIDPRFHAAQRMEQRRERMEKVLESIKGAGLAGESQGELERLVEVGLRFM